MDRRLFLKALIASATALNGLAYANDSSPTAEQVDAMEQKHLEIMSRYQSFLEGDKLTIGMLVYPGMFLMDLMGPLTVFEAMLNRDIHLLWKNRNPVNEKAAGSNSVSIPITPTTTFADCPTNLDVLFVPGGVPGTFNLMRDPEVVSFLHDQGRRSRFVTSVCTGSLVLGAAGLLNGYKATTHWATMDGLEPLGAVPVKQRVVVDRNRVTGGGVTSGLDFGLTLAGLLRSPEYAQAIQLYLEYDPKPPFNAGTPRSAPKDVLGFVTEMFGDSNLQARTSAREARAQYSKYF
jgi:cyclohexyl-isocyanide hydratase